MKLSEILNILAAIIIVFAVFSFGEIIASNFQPLPKYLLFSAVVVLVPLAARKLAANFLDADIEHRIWSFSRYWFRPHDYLRDVKIPGGIFFPLFFSLFSLGKIKFLSILTYETSALKRRAAKRHGYLSFTEMTDWHNGLIGAAGILGALALSFVSYFLPFAGLEVLAKFAAYYAFSNMIPLANFDGAQVFFGSKTLWVFLAILTLIFTGYALIL